MLRIGQEETSSVVDNTASPAGGEGRSVADVPLEARLDEALAFLPLVRPEGYIALTALHPDRGGAPTETFAPGEREAAHRWLERHSAEGWNLYWTVNPTRERITSKANKTDIENLDWIHVDIDPVDGADPAEARTAALDLLGRYKFQPTLTLDSGGGIQAFLRVKKPGLFIGCDEGAAEEAECFTRQVEIDLKEMIAADPAARALIRVDGTHDCCRLMRLPGTINRPNAKKRKAGREPRLASVIEYHAQREYALGDELEAAPSKNGAPTAGQVEVQLDGVPPFLASLDELPAAVTPRARMLIVQGCDPDEPDKYASRSEVTFAVACGMVRGGCTDEQIAAVLLDPEFAISAHTREQKRPLDYAARQIKNARDAVAEDGLGPGGRRVLNPHAPYEIAERLKAELFPTAIHTNDDWLEWRAGAYRDREDATVRSALYRELNKALVQKVTDGEVEYLPFNPDTTKVNKVLDALEMVAHQPADTMAPPVWLDGQGPPPLEIVACRNGLLHVPSGELLPPTPRFFTRNALDLDFDPDAPAPKEWLTFVGQVQPDPIAAELLQDWFGYLLLPDTSQHKMLFMKGPTRSGKGVTQQIITELVGEGNTCNPKSASLGSSNVGALQPLIGKTVAFISDARFGPRADKYAIAETLLTISGGDNVTIDRKYKDAWTGRLTTRFVMLSNELPSLRDNSPALANRFVPLIFEETFLGREDRELASRIIRSEMPGILNWALVGWRRLRERGHFVLPKASTDAITEIMELGSDVAAFIRDRCEVNPNRSVDKDRLFGAWQEWCKVNDLSPGRANLFARNLFDATNQQVKSKRASADGNRFYVFDGIGLLGGDEPPY